MCGPTGRFNNQRERKRVVISGAGPAGLLLSSLLLNKNKDANNPSVLYDVTLLDGRQDYGSFTKQELSLNHRSWMLGLADHGLDAIKTLPVLYEDYVKGEGILVRELNLYIGKKKMTMGADDFEATAKFRRSQGEEDSVPEAFIVDRNFIVAALARYLKDTHENDPHYTPRYETTCQYVDYENQRVLVRNKKTKKEEYVDYDLLVGCDGVRSVVREALVKRHSDFYLEYTDIFSEFKATHVKRPPSVSPNGMSVLPECFPGFQGIALPETGDLINFGIGVKRNLFGGIPEELKSDDYRVVAKFVKENFKAFELVDYDDFAKQWVGQRWNKTGMVHCNFYHSLKSGAIVIMGDAAHATSPSIGMGMNTALRDAQVFSTILEDTNHDFQKALPAFSEARVKEGNSLSDLAHHLYCHDTKHQLIETIHQTVRGYLYTKLPRFVTEHPFSMIGRRGIALSEVYERAVNLGIINKHRAINKRIEQQYFEQSVGMITTPSQNRITFSTLIVVGTILAAIAAYVYPKLI